VPIRDLVKQTLTPQRLSLTCWALAAILFGSVGLAAIQLDGPPRAFSDRFPIAGGGLPLPPAGPVSSTASIDGQRFEIEVLPGIQNRGTATTADVEGHIQTLRKEIIALRRRVEAIAIQNSQYSRRLSDLETRGPTVEETPATPGGDAISSKVGFTPEKPQDTAKDETPPAPVSETKARENPITDTGPHPAIASPVPLPKPQRAITAATAPVATVPAPEVVAANTQQNQPTLDAANTPADGTNKTRTDVSPEAGAPDDEAEIVTFVPDGPAPRLIEGPLPGFPMPDRSLPAPIGPKLMDEPVRIVELPTDSDEPLTTGSINPATATTTDTEHPV